MRITAAIIIVLAIQGVTLKDEIYALDEFIRSLSVSSATKVDSSDADTKSILDTIKEPLKETEIENLPIDTEVFNPEIIFTITVKENNTAAKTTTEIKGTLSDLQETLELKFKQIRRQALLDATHD